MVSQPIAGATGATGVGARVMSAYAALYGAVHDSLRSHGSGGFPCHTVTVLILSICVAANSATVLNVLWALGIVPSPYQYAAAAPGRHTLLEVVVTAVVQVNVIVALRMFRLGALELRPPRRSRSPVRWYLAASAVMVGLTCYVGCIAAR